MIKTVLGIEFYEGIPSAIYSHHFRDVSQCNLIVLDDRMSQSHGDKRIVDCFAKKSDHRYLLVIYIVRNILNQGKENIFHKVNSTGTLMALMKTTVVQLS